MADLSAGLGYSTTRVPTCTAVAWVISNRAEEQPAKNPGGMTHWEYATATQWADLGPQIGNAAAQPESQSM